MEELIESPTARAAGDALQDSDSMQKAQQFIPGTSTTISVSRAAGFCPRGASNVLSRAAGFSPRGSSALVAELTGDDQQAGPKILQRQVQEQGRQYYTRSAFSLVELVIVVVIIGIIAAVAVPRIGSAAVASAEAALVSNLSTIRRAIDTYAGEHDGILPGAQADGQGNSAKSAGAFVNQLTKYTDASGAVSDAPDPAHPFGPYLRAIPPLPVGQNRGSTVVAIDIINSPPVVTTGAEGWVYNPIAGEIIANSDDANAAGTRAYDEY